ncbi:MAG: hypothetical protein CSA33_04795 [Desulfobulbus propionicus]|nr:MAG: hypothetical protein CSA33_04795 [Desulfobulbus propionicus]
MTTKGFGTNLCKWAPNVNPDGTGPDFSSAQVMPGSQIFGTAFHLGLWGAKILPKQDQYRFSPRYASAEKMTRQRWRW